MDIFVLRETDCTKNVNAQDAQKEEEF